MINLHTSTFSISDMNSATTITDMDYQLDNLQGTDGAWGDTQQTIDPTDTFRLVFQNTNGLHSSSPLTELTFEALSDMNCGFFGVAESNLNSHNKHIKFNFSQTISKAWPHHRALFSSGSHGLYPEHVNSEYLPGGTAAWVSKHYISRVCDSGVDSSGLGRWTYTTLQGKQAIKLSIFPAYRVCNHSGEPGSLTSHMQQTTALELKNLAHRIANPGVKRSPSTDPRTSFIQDLIIAVKSCIAKGHKVIIMLDGNETWEESFDRHGNIRPGSIGDLIDSCDLTDILQQRFGVRAPTTTKTPNRPIDMILTHGIDVARAGILEADSPSASDHLALWLDLDVSTTFGDLSSPMQSLPQRLLTSKNLQTTTNYMEEVSSQFLYHCIEARLQILLDIFEATKTLDAAQQKALFTLDSQVTQIMLRAEKKSSKKSTRKSKWSPAFKQAGQAVSYWERRCRMENFGCDKYLRKLGQRCGISHSVQDTVFTEVSCKTERAKARGVFTQMKKHQVQLREDFLDNTAELLSKGDLRKKATAVKSIKAGEKLRRDFSIIKHALGKSHSGLANLEIVNSLGLPETLTDKTAIHEALLTFNKAHYQQSNETPGGSKGPAHFLFDPDNPANQIEEILSGKHTTWDGISAESQLWMDELGTITDTIINTTITEAHYIKHFKSHPERTSSSPSGLHIGHHITAAQAKDGCLRRVLSKICHLSINAACPLPRWLHIVQVILEKGKGPKLGSLRIIQLAEADLNFVLKVIWSKGLIDHATTENLLDPAQYALPGKQCIGAVLAKVLFLDICRQMRTDCGFAETDAKACFDRVIPLLAIVTCRRIGLPSQAAIFMNLLLRQLTFKLRTAHGMSDTSYSANDDSSNPGNGSGQGLSFSPPLWIGTSDPLLRAMRKTLPGVTFSHPGLKTLVAWLQITMFMDDATMYAQQMGLSTNHFERIKNSHMPTLPAILSNLLQSFNGLLWMTGGRLCLEKCMWYWISWKRGSKDTYKLSPVKDTPGSIRVLEELECGTYGPQNFIEIPRKAPREPHRTLGVIISPDGSRKPQLDLQIKKAQNWNTLINARRLYGDTRWLAFRSVLTPALFYPLPLHCFLESELAKLDRQVSITAKNSLGLPRSYPTALVSGPISYGGIGSYSSYSRAGAAKVELFLRHARSNDEGGKLLHISLGHSQLELGKGTQLFDLSFLAHGAVLTKTWITHLWQFLEQSGSKMVSSRPIWIPPIQRVADRYIMELADELYPGQTKRLIILNKCRCYIHAVTLADITSSDGIHITADAYNGILQHGRKSRYDWPSSLFKPGGWRLWQTFLHSIAPSKMSAVSDDGSETDSVTSSQDWRFRMDPSETLYLWDEESARPFVVNKAASPDNAYLAIRSTVTVVTDPPTDTDWDAWDRADVLENCVISKNRIYLTNWTAYSCLPNTASAPSLSTPIFSTIVRCDRPEEHIFKTLIESLPNEQRRHIGDILIPSTSALAELIESIRLSTATCVCDGSMKNRRGSHAWILSSTENFVRLEGAGPADGNPSTMSSYRPELQGLIALLTVISSLAATYSITSGAITIACDNISAINKVDDMLSNPALYCIAPSAKEYDLLLVIQDLLISLPIHMIPVHVKGHKDDTTDWDDLTFQQQLNIECDRSAKLWLAANEGTEKSPQPTARVFHSERWAVLHGSIKLTSNVKNTLLEAFHGVATVQYLKEKYKWPNDVFSQIDWPAIGTVFGKISTPTRVKHSKLMHSWLPVMTRTARYTRSADNLCPLCLTVPETQDHIYCCSSPDATKHRAAAWQCCLETLRTKGKTSRHILDAFDSGGTIFLQLPPRPVLYTTRPVPAILTTSFGSAQAAQDDIGWQYIFRGFISQEWGTTQALYSHHIEKPTAHWSVEHWKRIVVAALLEFGHSLWKYRNDTKFGKDKQDTARLLRAQLELRVSNRYASKPYLLPKFVHVFEKPLLVQLRQGNRALSAWLRYLESYTTISKHAVDHGGRQRDFRSYLPHPHGSTPPRYLDVAAERALRRRKSAHAIVPKVIQKVRKARKKTYPQPHPNLAARITRSHFRRQQVPIPITLAARSSPLFGILPSELTTLEIPKNRTGIG